MKMTHNLRNVQTFVAGRSMVAAQAALVALAGVRVTPGRSLRGGRSGGTMATALAAAGAVSSLATHCQHINLDAKVNVRS